MRRIKQKLNNSSAFTLAETLVAILILLMVSSVVAAGIPAAANAYKKVVRASNAEVLLSTTISALRNELGTARILEKPSGTNIKYYNATSGIASMIFVDDDDNTIKYQQYIKTEFSTNEENGDDGDKSVAQPLVSSGLATDNLTVVYSSIAYDKNKNIITVSGLKVKDKNDKSSTEDSGLTIKIRVLS